MKRIHFLALFYCLQILLCNLIYSVRTKGNLGTEGALLPKSGFFSYQG